VQLGDLLWSLLVICFILFSFMILFRIAGDLFSDHETSGLGKTAWTTFMLRQAAATDMATQIADAQELLETRAISQQEFAALRTRALA
jgi:hypothetical protein